MDRVWRRAKLELYRVVARQKTRFECADLFLNQMSFVVAEPNRRSWRGRDDNELVVHRLYGCIGHWALSLLAFTRTSPSPTGPACRPPAGRSLWRTRSGR